MFAQVNKRSRNVKHLAKDLDIYTLHTKLLSPLPPFEKTPVDHVHTSMRVCLFLFQISELKDVSNCWTLLNSFRGNNILNLNHLYIAF